ncbi:hypothetical protein ACQP1G_42410 [Nocardia sp. CA-107356]|uniref:hypothetical protein n=1 Tax=Nocardia sp. CA-107356 TaxID=3239972 RepID=UPI003D8EF23A
MPTVDDLIEAISGRDTDDPISAAISAMFALNKQRWLSLSMLVDPNPSDIDAMLIAADRLAAALSEIARYVHAIDRHITASVRLAPVPDAQVAERTIGEFAAAITYAALCVGSERAAGTDHGSAARLSGLCRAYDGFRDALLSGASRLPQRRRSSDTAHARSRTADSAPPVRPALVGEGACVACKKLTDTGIAVVGTGEWPVAILMRLGWSFEEAMVLISDITGCMESLSETARFATVPKDEVTLLVSLCTECAARQGSFHVEAIGSGRVPLYKQTDYYQPTQDDLPSGEGETENHSPTT